jgi:hypothetical protein
MRGGLEGSRPRASPAPDVTVTGHSTKVLNVDEAPAPAEILAGFLAEYGSFMCGAGLQSSSKWCFFPPFSPFFCEKKTGGVNLFCNNKRGSSINNRRFHSN